MTGGGRVGSTAARVTAAIFQSLYFRDVPARPSMPLARVTKEHLVAGLRALMAGSW
jgi:hypothetical protein